MMLAKQSARPCECASSTNDWDAFLSSVLQQSAPSSQVASEQRKTLAQIMQSSDFCAKTSVADWLLFEKNHDGAITLYNRIAVDHPEETGFCLRSIGTAHYFLGDYETAIDFYQKALAGGEDPEIIAADISEARDAIMMRNQQRREAA
jgi:tetratricopeptide (TPR) repeat protein